MKKSASLNIRTELIVTAEQKKLQWIKLMYRGLLGPFLSDQSQDPAMTKSCLVSMIRAVHLIDQAHAAWLVWTSSQIF